MTTKESFPYTSLPIDLNKSDIPCSKFLWKNLRQDKNNPIKYREYVLHIGLIQETISPMLARLCNKPELAGTWHDAPVLTAFLIDCGQGTVYIRGDLGEIGGEGAVTLEEGEDFLTLKIEAIAAFAKAMGIEVEEREDGI